MTPDEAADLAERTLEKIPDRDGHPAWDRVYAADRERVESDLAGLRECLILVGCAYQGTFEDRSVERLAAVFSGNLLRTAALYGVTP